MAERRRPRWDVAPLRLADCDELGEVHVRVWRETYAGVMPADHLDGLSPQRSAATWRGIAESPAHPGGGTLLARDGAGRLVGFVSSGPSRDADAPTEWELYVLNLVAEVHGSGLADLLLDRALGARDATLWVAAANARGRAFYSRRGFRLEGAAASHDPTGISELRMVRRGGQTPL
ncbi:MAG: GNAT family N-acetyltransferase [Terracoccus sp.]